MDEKTPGRFRKWTRYFVRNAQTVIFHEKRNQQPRNIYHLNSQQSTTEELISPLIGSFIVLLFATLGATSPSISRRFWMLVPMRKSSKTPAFIPANRRVGSSAIPTSVSSNPTQREYITTYPYNFILRATPKNSNIFDEIGDFWVYFLRRISQRNPYENGGSSVSRSIGQLFFALPLYLKINFIIYIISLIFVFFKSNVPTEKLIDRLTDWPMGKM